MGPSVRFVVAPGTHGAKVGHRVVAAIGQGDDVVDGRGHGTAPAPMPVALQHASA
jgi:hypothetical protein